MPQDFKMVNVLQCEFHLLKQINNHTDDTQAKRERAQQVPPVPAGCWEINYKAPSGDRSEDTMLQ